MIVKLLRIPIFCLLAIVSAAQKPASSLTTPIIIQGHGYPVEQHTVQTTDGYILTMHRIPYSTKLNNGASQRPVAFLFHGILCASSVWVLSGPEKSLAYILSDAGYDVWMGNARGTVYSSEHITLNTSSTNFWNFEWHHMGIYDIPAMLDYIREETGEVQVRYFGHSQGSTAFLVLNTELPRYKNRFRSAHLFAPVAFFNNTRSPLAVRLSGTKLGQPNPAIEELGSVELLPSSRTAELIGGVLCRDGLSTQVLCSRLLFAIAGGPSPFLNTTLLPKIAAIMPAGISINQLYHLLQLKNSARFCQFDYGPERNLAEYGSIEAPDYNLQNLDVPTYLYYSDNDDLADPIDVNRLILALNGTKALKGSYRVPYTEWNHIDFLFGLGVENVVYSVVMDDIANS